MRKHNAHLKSLHPACRIFHKNGGGAGGGGGKSGGGGNSRSSGSGGVDTPSGYTIKGGIDTVGQDYKPDYVFEIAPSSITKQTEKAIMIKTKTGKVWIPKSQIEGWYSGKDGKGKPGIKVKPFFGEKEIGHSKLKRHPGKIFEI